jgi:hypothetical protein
MQHWVSAAIASHSPVLFVMPCDWNRATLCCVLGTNIWQGAKAVDLACHSRICAYVGLAGCHPSIPGFPDGEIAPGRICLRAQYFLCCSGACDCYDEHDCAMGIGNCA